MPSRQGEAEHRTAKPEDRSDREIDASDDQHVRHADGDEDGVGNLVGDGAKCRCAEKMSARETKEADHHREHKREPEILGKVLAQCGFFHRASANSGASMFTSIYLP